MRWFLGLEELAVAKRILVGGGFGFGAEMKSRARLFCWLAAVGVWQTAADPKASDREWQIYHGDYGGSHYSALTQINRSNVARLKPAWIWRAGETGRAIECNPIVVDGVVYLTTPRLHCVALAGKTGRLLWRFNPWPKGERGGGVSRGVAYWTDGKGERRIFHSAGDFLYALNAETGRPVASFGQGGRIRHRDGLDTDAFFL